MRDVLDDDQGKLSKIAIVVMGATAIVSGLILFNVIFGQTATGRVGHTLLSDDVPEGASTRVDVSVGSTITLSYDVEVEQVQRELTAAGFYKDAVDGVMGKKTKLAIEQYQQSLSIPVTGEVSPELIDHIRYTRQISQAAEFTGSIAKVVEPEKVNEQESIETVQMSLSSMGYEPGPINGKLNEETQSAILKFAMDRNLPMDTTITPELLAELAKSTDQDQPTAQ